MDKSEKTQRILDAFNHKLDLDSSKVKNCGDVLKRNSLYEKTMKERLAKAEKGDFDMSFFRTELPSFEEALENDESLESKD